MAARGGGDDSAAVRGTASPLGRVSYSSLDDFNSAAAAAAAAVPYAAAPAAVPGAGMGPSLADVDSPAALTARLAGLNSPVNAQQPRTSNDSFSSVQSDDLFDDDPSDEFVRARDPLPPTASPAPPPPARRADLTDLRRDSLLRAASPLMPPRDSSDSFSSVQSDDLFDDDPSAVFARTRPDPAPGDRGPPRATRTPSPRSKRSRRTSVTVRKEFGPGQAAGIAKEGVSGSMKDRLDDDLQRHVDSAAQSLDDAGLAQFENVHPPPPLAQLPTPPRSPPPPPPPPPPRSPAAPSRDYSISQFEVGPAVCEESSTPRPSEIMLTDTSAAAASPPALGCSLPLPRKSATAATSPADRARQVKPKRTRRRSSVTVRKQFGPSGNATTYARSSPASTSQISPRAQKRASSQEEPIGRLTTVTPQTPLTATRTTPSPRIRSRRSSVTVRKEFGPRGTTRTSATVARQRASPSNHHKNVAQELFALLPATPAQVTTVATAPHKPPPLPVPTLPATPPPPAAPAGKLNERCSRDNSMSRFEVRSGADCLDTPRPSEMTSSAANTGLSAEELMNRSMSDFFAEDLAEVPAAADITSSSENGDVATMAEDPIRPSRRGTYTSFLTPRGQHGRANTTFFTASAVALIPTEDDDEDSDDEEENEEIKDMEEKAERAKEVETAEAVVQAAEAEESVDTGERPHEVFPVTMSRAGELEAPEPPPRLEGHILEHDEADAELVPPSELIDNQEAGRGGISANAKLGGAWAVASDVVTEVDVARRFSLGGKKQHALKRTPSLVIQLSAAAPDAQVEEPMDRPTEKTERGVPADALAAAPATTHTENLAANGHQRSVSDAIAAAAAMASAATLLATALEGEAEEARAELEASATPVRLRKRVMVGATTSFRPSPEFLRCIGVGITDAMKVAPAGEDHRRRRTLRRTMLSLDPPVPPPSVVHYYSPRRRTQLQVD